MRNRLKTILAIAFVWGMAIQTNAQEMNKVPTVKLNNGMEMPQLGVGTFLVKDDAAERVCHAIKVGFRLIDTAQGYGNEKEVGEGIRRSGIDRRELFITTKVNTTEMRGGTVRQSLDKSLADLGTDYIDLVLIHWPVKGHIKETWQILEEYVDKGKIRSIGVSNFNPHHLDELLEYARIRPVVNQIEIEPYMTQHDVVGYTFRRVFRWKHGDRWDRALPACSMTLQSARLPPGTVNLPHRSSCVGTCSAGWSPFPAATTMRTRTRISVSSTSSFRLPKWRLLPV